MAKRAAKKATKKGTSKKPIESYDQQDKKRKNNPPVGLVTPRTDPDAGHRKTHEYDPQIDARFCCRATCLHRFQNGDTDGPPHAYRR